MKINEKTKIKFSKAFEKWEEDYRKNPYDFMDDFYRFTKVRPKTYGELSTDCFIKYLNLV
ncbi:MAG: hypothetical protein AABY22_25675 [Nanoarchaeota archaeon]